MAEVWFQHSRAEIPDASAFERHCHSGAELLYVVEGAGEFSIEGRRFPLKGGTLGLFRANEYHFVCPQETSPYERFVVNFGLDVPFGEAEKLPLLFCNDESRLWFDADAVDPQIPAALRAIDHAQALFDTQAIGKEALYTIQRALISEILLLLPGEEKKETGYRGSTLSVSLISYLNANLSEKLSLEQLSRAFFVSKSYLCREFHRATGLSILSYVNTKRLMLAKSLIQSGMAPAEAAQKAGFGDYSAFFRAYKKEFGTSPRSAKKDTP